MSFLNPLEPYFGAIKGIAITGAVIGAIWGVIHLKNVYDKGVADKATAPLRQQITLLEGLRKADADSAARQLEARKIENEKALQGYVEYAREADNKYVTDLAALNRLRDHAAALKRGSPAGQAGTGNPATPDSTPAAVTTTGEPDPVTDEIALYAAEVHLYAQSCYEFVNGK